MSKEQTYNGWTNYETWVTKLWMDNDQGSQELFNELAREHKESVYDLSIMIKDMHEENAPEVTGVYADLITSALQSVNWYEIAESLIEDLEEE